MKFQFLKSASHQADAAKEAHIYEIMKLADNYASAEAHGRITEAQEWRDALELTVRDLAYPK